jgi:hypothetical protein
MGLMINFCFKRKKSYFLDLGVFCLTILLDLVMGVLAFYDVEERG